ncbi:MAG: bacteriohemerythrin [Methylococcaceae bacterium]
MDSFADNNFFWLDKYAIGQDTIDKQHQYLFELANIIVDPYNDPQTTYLNIQALYEYTQTHFRDEELLMEQCDYPDYENHKKAHRQLIAKLNTVGNGILTDEAPRTVVIHFMKDWILTHILSEDMRFGNFLRTSASFTDSLQTQQDSASTNS